MSLTGSEASGSVRVTGQNLDPVMSRVCNVEDVIDMLCIVSVHVLYETGFCI